MPTLPQLVEEDIGELTHALQELLIKSDAAGTLIIDKGGFIIAQIVHGLEFDTMSLAALSAGSFAATESSAQLIGEKNFSNIYQQGEVFSLLVSNVDQYCLLAVIFKATLSVGAVKYYATDTIKKIAAQLVVAQNRAPNQGLDLSMLNLADPSEVFRKKVA